MTAAYQYDPLTKMEVERMARLALPDNTKIKPATLLQDFGGIDGHLYRVAGHCPLQVRVRKDRPYGSADKDITFRTTEQKMIREHTYAPLALFVWLQKGYAVAGKLIDVYRMADHIDPPLNDRAPIPNFDGVTAFVCVEIYELVKAGALLRQGDRDSWATARADGLKDLERILARTDWAVGPRAGVKGHPPP
jgi:hypothetical protein